MRSDVDERFRQALSELGSGKRWYQTDTDVLFAAVVAAVDGVESGDVLARRDVLKRIVGVTDEVGYIACTVAAVSAARSVQVPFLIAAADSVKGMLRTAIRSARIRRIAGVIIAADNPDESESKADRVITLHQAWNQHDWVRTSAVDLLLAAITEAGGVERMTSLDRAGFAVDHLAAAGYSGEWEVARILALDAPVPSVERFLGLAGHMRGRRKKPLTDLRSSIAIAGLAHHPLHELLDMMQSRVRALQTGRHGARTALTLAALLTLGESVPPGHRIHDAFHALALREHYLTALGEETSG